MKRTILLTLAMLVACAYRSSDGLSSGRVEGLSPELLTPRNAQQIRSGRTGGVERLSYEVDIPYPASDLINTIAGEMAKRGWRPIRNNWHNRGEASEYLRGWVLTIAVDRPGGREQFYARWWAQWQNDRGDVVDYHLAFLSPSQEFTNRTRLLVVGTKMPAEIAVATNNIYQESGAEGASKGLVLLPRGTPPNAATATDNSPDPRVFRVRPDGA